MAFLLDESSCDSILDFSVDPITFEEKENGTRVVKFVVPKVNIPPPKKRKHTNNEARTGAGRKPLAEKIPELVMEVNDIVTQNGYAADSRRRTAVGKSCGVTLNQIQEKVHKITGLESVSKSTIHRLTVAPNKKFSASRHYLSKVNAKVPRKRNDKRKESLDAHYYSSRVKYRVEFASKYSEQCSLMSCDTMNKVNVGVLAVSRYHQNEKFFPIEDAPNLPDHDFPSSAGNKLVPCGYMFLEANQHSSMFEDEQGRTHFRYPRSGPSVVINRAQKYHTLTIQSHVNDLHVILNERQREKKPMLVIIADGGPDWNTRSWAVFLYLTKFFLDENLDLLCTTAYAPGYSAYNPIEHLWAPLSKALTGVIFPDHMDGHLPPEKIKDISSEERRKEDQAVMDQALELLNGYWNGKTFDGFSITSRSHPCSKSDEPYGDYSTIAEIVKNRCNAKQDQDVCNILKFAMKHGDRRNGEFTIMKCDDMACVHCVSNPPTDESAAILRELREHGGMPSPSRRNESDTSFLTYIEAMKAPHVKADHGLPRFESGQFGRCPVCPSYVFLSTTDAVNHMYILHDVSPKQTKQGMLRKESP